MKEDCSQPLRIPEDLASLLVSWYRREQRQLPWRYTYDPYHILISEIMLQQTQMERGVAYFNRWIERFPDVAAVAAAEEQEILCLWQGLGYYARARNIHRAAKEIVTRFAGVVPGEYQALLGLPGIGPYTAAAIASIAGNNDVAVVDTNVARVYARVFDLSDNVKAGRGLARVRALAEEILPAGRARHYNQAIMDFGGLLCTPRAPKCGACPLRKICLARCRGVVDQRPVLPARKERLVERKIVGLIRCENRFLLRQRGKQELWAGLWDLPGVLLYSENAKSFREPPLPDTVRLRELLVNAAARELTLSRFLVSVKHQYTNHSRTVDCWLCSTSEKKSAKNERWVGREEFDQYGVSAGTRKIFDWLRDNPLF